VTPARWLVLGPADRAAQACAGLSYPLVVKVLPSDAEHKTEMGLVKLRVQTPEDVDRLAADFRQRMGKPQAGILVQEMVGEGVEVVLSCLRTTDFGPVLAVMTYASEDEAVAIANGTPFGLGAYVFSTDREQGRRVCERLQAGRVFYNGDPGDLSAPMGGYKQSGNGREVGVFGLEEYCEVKAVFGFQEPAAKAE
jgi:acyl-CoA reductase-like NAD-dependent aldehyde dehydrogenase